MPFFVVARRKGRVVGRKHTANPKIAASDVQRLRMRFSAPVDISIEYDDGSSSTSALSSHGHGSASSASPPKKHASTGHLPKSPLNQSHHAAESDDFAALFGGGSTPPMPMPMFEYSQSAGSVLINSRGRVLLRQPTNQFGGYQWTFGKGGVDPGETAKQAAIRETLEELGWDAEIVAPIPGKFKATTTETSYYLMRPIAENLTPLDSPPPKKVGPFPGRKYPDWETAALQWLTESQARDFIALTANPKGRERDLQVLAAAFNLWRKLKE